MEVNTESASKKVLVVLFSQSGQLSRVVDNFTRPLVESEDVEVIFEVIEPQESYPFPWPFLRFFNTFPECVCLDPPAIKASCLNEEEEYDLVIIAYQVWFLSPSLPITAFMQSNLAAKLLKDKPVVTLIACRNMWLMAQEDMKAMIEGLDAELVGNVALVDEAGTIGSFLATPVWVMTGKKGPHWCGLIPRAGVAEEAIRRADRFGYRLLERLRSGCEIDSHVLVGLDAVSVNEKLIASEIAAKRSFRIWGGLLRSIGSQENILRKLILCLFIVYLLLIIVILAPLNIIFKTLLSPFTKKKVDRQKAYYSQPSGNSKN